MPPKWNSTHDCRGIKSEDLRMERPLAEEPVADVVVTTALSDTPKKHRPVVLKFLSAEYDLHGIVIAWERFKKQKK